MTKLLFHAILCITVLAAVDAGFLRDLIHGKTTTEQPTSTVSSVTTTKRPSLYISNNIPHVESGTTVHFECKKKLKTTETPKPCVKYCVKLIDYPNGTKVRGQPHECFELNQDVLRQELEEAKKAAGGANGTVDIMQVALIDFPCQPGYLPDSRGRCREVW